MLPTALRSFRPSISRSLVSKTCSIALVSMLTVAGSLPAQTAAVSAASDRAPVSRLTQPIVESNRVALKGTLHPLATKANDRGAVGDGMKLDRIQVVLKRSDAQEAALKQLIGEMHSKGSASYHKWLTPEDFGKQFGPSDADVAKLEGWLSSHGFSITKLNPGRQTLEIAGTAGQFRDAFHTEIHSYRVKDAAGTLETHFANAGAPEIPTALAPVFGGFASLNNFHLKSYTHVLGTAQYTPATHTAKPDWTYGSGSDFTLFVTPADFAVQYDVNPLYTAGTKGDGQSIAIVNEANINIALVNNYRALFGLPVNPPQVVIDGSDPGIDGNNSPFGRNGASIEAYLDVEVAGAVAPDAQVNLVIADSTALEDGLSLAAERAVYSNISPVISLSFGYCEAFLGSGNAFWNNLWEQAAAQGITVMVSTGDSGSAGCDDDNSQEFAVYGQEVNGFASTPYNVAVGGTDFYYSGGSASFANYWSNLSNPTTNTPSESLTTKIPEQPFNSSQFGLNIDPQSSSTSTSIFAAGGGASTAGLAGAGANGAYGPYPKPSWQSGTGVPADSARDIPDVSLFGALDTNNSLTPICSTDGDCETPATVVQLTGVGGTSVAAPEFAGVMALVNQRYGRQGQANYVLYPLAAASRAGTIPSAFNDVTAGTNTVPCNLDTVVDSDNNNAEITPNDCQTASPAYTVDDQEFGTSLEGEIGVTANAPSYNAATGYDLASGLGSVDVNNLVTNWGSVRTGTSTTTLTAPATFAHGAAVTISGTVSGTSPTGNVALLTTSTDPNTQGETLFPLVNGAYTGSVNFLPGGTYNLSAYYSGDGSNGPSTSAPVQVTVTPETSTTALTVYTTALANTPGTLASGGTVAYGAVTALSAKATGTTSGAASQPTGSVTFSDGGAALNTAVVNVEGDAEFTKAFAIGSHSITAKYSGDGSFGASSTAAATTFNVVADTPSIYVTYTNADTNGDAVNGQTTYVAVQVENSSSYANAQALPPAGTLTVTGAPSGVPTIATLVPSIDPQGSVPEGTAYFAFPASQSGTSNLTLTFTPSDANYTTKSISGSISFVGSAGSIATTISASANAATTSPTSAVEVTSTVTAASGGVAPTGTVVLYASEEAVGFANLPTSSSSSATVTIGLSSSALFGGTNQITAQFYPNTNTYIGSATSFTVANPLNDFSLVPVTTIVNVPGPGAVSAGVQTDVINLNSYSGFSGGVNLTCTGSGGVTCSLSSPSVTLASGGTGSSTLSVNTSAVTAAGTYNVVVTGTDSTGHLIHTIGLQVVTPLIVASTTPGFSLAANPATVSISAPGGAGTTTITATPVNGFTGTVALTCAITGPAGATGVPTCSAASESITTASAATATLTFNTLSTTTAGSYTATVTGTSGTTTAATTVGVTVVGAVVTPGTFSLSNSAAITVGTQGGAGTSMISVVPGATNPYTGSVALTCAVTTSPTGASEIPTCSLNPASVTLAGTTLTSTLTINTTAQTGKLELPLKRLFAAGGGVALATLLFLGLPVGRRGRQSLRAVRTLRILSVALLFAMIAGAGIGCGGGSSSSSGGTTPTGGTTTGAYTITVTATPASGTAQTVAVGVTVN